MVERGTLEGDDRLRLFVALRLPPATVDRLAAWQAQELSGRPGVRILPKEHLHVTVAFLGSRPRGDVPRIVAAVREAALHAPRPVLATRGYRETQRVGMVTLSEAEPRYAHRFAGSVMIALEELGVYERERRDWLPHVTVARFRTPPRLDPPLPELGTFSPSEAALYHSVLRPTGAQYELLESVALGGSSVD